MRPLGVVATRHIWMGIVEDHRLVDTRLYPSPGEGVWNMRSMAADEIAETMRDQIARAIKDWQVEAVGVRLPGILPDGRVGECPNNPPIRGYHPGPPRA